MRAVLAATIEAIIESGTTRVSIDAVAARAEVNKTTIYRRWPTRGELVLAAILDHVGTAVPVPDTGSLRTDLEEICRSVRDGLTSGTGRVLVAASRAEVDRGLDEFRGRFWDERFRASAEILRRAAARGECRPVDRPEVLMEQLAAPIHFRLAVLGRPVDEAYIHELVGRFERMLAAPERAVPERAAPERGADHRAAGGGPAGVGPAG